MAIKPLNLDVAAEHAIESAAMLVGRSGDKVRVTLILKDGVKLELSLDRSAAQSLSQALSVEVASLDIPRRVDVKVVN